METRGIKFRAWDDRNKIMSYPDSFGEFEFIINDEVVRSGQTIGCLINKHYPDIFLMQYTGLKDKEGREVYEGDIFGTLEQLRGVIEREENGAYVLRFVHPTMNNKKISILDPQIERSEIKGNIYESPELISTKQL